MIQISVIVDRPIQDVWDYFIKPSNWLQWYGGEVKAVEPDWRVGANIVWGLGGQSAITSFDSMNKLTICGNAYDTTYIFADNGNKTEVTVIESDPKGNYTYSDGGIYNRTEWTKCMNKLKESIERIAPTDKFCTNCGKLISEDWKFCNGCGKPLYTQC